MIQVWRNYFTDLSRAYPMYALSIEQINNTSTPTNPIDLLPPAILTNLMEVKYPCAVRELTPRQLVLFASDGGQFRLNYPLPFSQTLSDYLTANTAVQAFEFVGERIRYGRLRRMLENV